MTHVELIEILKKEAETNLRLSKYIRPAKEQEKFAYKTNIQIETYNTILKLLKGESPEYLKYLKENIC